MISNNSNLKVGIIGFGSIGKRHCQNLIKIGISNIILFRENGNSNELNLREIFDFKIFIEYDFDFIIISNPTYLHIKYLKQLLPLNKNLFVEKPLIANFEDFKILKQLLINYKAIGMCAFNMHFHPCIAKVKEIVNSHKLGWIYSARFFVGQFLPDWRINVDYTKSYSAKREKGGGVVLDLIHEIDLAINLCGDIKNEILSIVRKVSDLKIDCEDIAEIMYESNDNIIVSIHLDYLSKVYSRYFEIVAENGNMYCDLFTNDIIVDFNGYKEKCTFQFERNDMYISLIKYYVECIKTKSQPSEYTLQDSLVSLKAALNIRKNYEKQPR